MVDVLKAKGVSIALVAGSGSSIYGMGAPPEAPGAGASTSAIRATRSTAAEVFLKNMSMSTSGSYEKFFRAEAHYSPHHGPPYRLPGAGQRIGLGDRPAHPR